MKPTKELEIKILKLIPVMFEDIGNVKLRRSYNYNNQFERNYIKYQNVQFNFVHGVCSWYFKMGEFETPRKINKLLKKLVKTKVKEEEYEEFLLKQQKSLDHLEELIQNVESVLPEDQHSKIGRLSLFNKKD